MAAPPPKPNASDAEVRAYQADLHQRLGGFSDLAFEVVDATHVKVKVTTAGVVKSIILTLT